MAYVNLFARKGFPLLTDSGVPECMNILPDDQVTYLV